MATQATEIRLKRLNERLRKKYRNPSLKNFSVGEQKIIRKMKLINRLYKRIDYLETEAMNWLPDTNGKLELRIDNNKLSPEWNLLDKKHSTAYKALYKLEKEYNLVANKVYKDYMNQSVMGGSF